MRRCASQRQPRGKISHGDYLLPLVIGQEDNRETLRPTTPHHRLHSAGLRCEEEQWRRPAPPVGHLNGGHQASSLVELRSSTPAVSSGPSCFCRPPLNHHIAGRIRTKTRRPGVFFRERPRAPTQDLLLSKLDESCAVVTSTQLSRKKKQPKNPRVHPSHICTCHIDEQECRCINIPMSSRLGRTSVPLSIPLVTERPRGL